MHMSTSRLRKVKRPKLGRSSNGMLMTPEEFDAVTDVDDRYRYELIHGVLIVSRLPSIGERDPNEELGYLLRLYRDTLTQDSTLDATVSEGYVYLVDSRRRADRVIWIGLGRVPDPEKDVPTIAVEFVSKSTRDRVRDYEEKRRDYLAVGVSEYWVIDRFRRTMTVFRQPPAEPAEQVFDAAATYRTPLLPGFELPLSKLFARSDYWKRPRKKP
jgi:Uma2 family endonuclease